MNNIIVQYNALFASFFRWSKNSGRIASGLDSGPLVLFDRAYDTLIISSFNHFMAMSATYEKGNLIFDLQYQITLHYTEKEIDVKDPMALTCKNVDSI